MDQVSEEFCAYKRRHFISRIFSLPCDISQHFRRWHHSEPILIFKKIGRMTQFWIERLTWNMSLKREPITLSTGLGKNSKLLIIQNWIIEKFKIIWSNFKYINPQSTVLMLHTMNLTLGVACGRHQLMWNKNRNYRWIQRRVKEEKLRKYFYFLFGCVN